MTDLLPADATSIGGERSTPTRSRVVLDTSVLLSDPRAMLRFAEHQVVLPVVVISELEAKRHHPELGYFARQALRLQRAHVDQYVGQILAGLFALAGALEVLLGYP